MPEMLTLPSRLLISVRNAKEAEFALNGGAGLIDLKEPSRGALGWVDLDTVRAVINVVAQTTYGERRTLVEDSSGLCQQCGSKVSAALGEWGELPSAWWEDYAGLPLAYVKLGLAGCGGRADFPEGWLAARQEIDQRIAPLVAVAYADWQCADAPSVERVAEIAIEEQFSMFLLDTWSKDGTTLLDWLRAEEVIALSHRLQGAGVEVALAGSLNEASIERLLPAKPAWFAVRSAACRGGQRDEVIDEQRVRVLAELIGRSAR